eukprot:TRINITY_DN5748_c0_g2_i1.p2 TRINITY_DN5748_c0_g2~~TRINITY_DN5748_c0_g2_i1.p2  ORF type:complete len:147 (+),score=0.51 TRINITY_DN5748_c0_g2_i1:326-766(+)
MRVAMLSHMPSHLGVPALELVGHRAQLCGCHLGPSGLPCDPAPLRARISVPRVCSSISESSRRCHTFCSSSGGATKRAYPRSRAPSTLGTAAAVPPRTAYLLCASGSLRTALSKCGQAVCAVVRKPRDALSSPGTGARASVCRFNI